ncbi:MAG: glycosyltransferase family 4 protein [Candidatus Bathyarchaeota archaeon]|nr:glycosyltransferase family 4 protein [Candidatus Bathyarchaeota archaeon]
MKICFLSLNSYPTIADQQDSEYAGGAEVEQVILGKKLYDKGCAIAFVTYWHGTERKEVIKGIEIIKTYKRDAVSRISSFRKVISIFSALKKANADVYVHEAGSTGVLPIFCFIFRKKFVHRIATDSMVTGVSLNGKKSLIDSLSSLIELKRADSIIAQSKFQQYILKKRFNLSSVLIKNGCELPNAESEKSQATALWVGTISSVKNPLLYIEVAKALPSLHFEMIGGKGDPPELFSMVQGVAKGVPNLHFNGFVAHSKIGEYFKNASVLVNTSSIEGFPNTMLEAWTYYLPVVSLRVDPDGIIYHNQLGMCSKNFSQLVKDVSKLLLDYNLRLKLGTNGRNYVLNNHEIGNIVGVYLNVFNSLWHKAESN